MSASDNSSLSNLELGFKRADLLEVIRVQEEMSRRGVKVPKLASYWDEVYAVINEQNRRMEVGQ